MKKLLLVAILAFSALTATTVHHFKYIADINSFFSITETVCIIIEEAMKKK